ncbi:extracellular solute-binding protein [Pullulanibacillus sp. KACC 23026]|uniref:ABC transporter substrate-binding protein n=1 Tax=Pullulanibacillus sp. KACC 23026 TaxID=3028315 RepID=UPI0023B1474D|nr:extracellular solute-binding protein [Pullulanibacillus sp. KACC 23026]WEG13494.1 extracellular solute-binding protein [Pullulanibacillus sp. KACC 23026]
MKKLVVLFLLVVSALLVFTGCGSQSSTASNSSSSGGDSGKQITLRFAYWGDQTRDQLTQKVIKLYEQSHPNIKIIPEFSGMDGYFQKLDTEFAAGNAPDIIQYGGNINDYVNKGVVLPLNQYEGKGLDVSKHPKSMLDAATFNGKLYGVCIGVNAGGVLIDKTLFKKANVPLPSDNWTWDDMENIGKQVTKGLNNKVYGLLAFDETGFGTYLAQRNKVAFDNTTNKVGYTEKDVQDWFQMWENMRKVGAAAPAALQAQNQTDPAQSLIAKGDVAMQFVFSNQYSSYIANSKDQFELHLPPNSGGTTGVALLPSQFLAGNAHTKYPKQVADFLNFFVNNVDAGKILGMNRGIPVNPDVRDAVAKTASPEDQQVLNYIDEVTKTSKAAPTPNYPGYVQEEDLYKQTDQSIAFHKKSVQAASQEYYTKLQQIVKQNLNQ